MTDALMKRGNLDTGMRTGRMPCEAEDRVEIILLKAKEHQSQETTRS